MYADTGTYIVHVLMYIQCILKHTNTLAHVCTHLQGCGLVRSSLVHLCRVCGHGHRCVGLCVCMFSTKKPTQHLPHADAPEWVGV